MSGSRDVFLFSRITIVVALCAAAAPAEEPLTIDGLTDFYYGYNFNRPADGDVQLREYDGRHDCIRLNLSELSLQRRATAAQPVGFRLDLDYGATPRVNAAAEPASMHRFQDIGQAYVSLVAPVGSGLRLEAGKFYTFAGNEVVKTSGNWNYSRSLLFTLAEPTYHAGLRASYDVNEHLVLSAHLVNGWNQTHGATSIGLQAAIAATPALSIATTYLGGPADSRRLVNAVMTYAASPKVAVAVNTDYGRDVNGRWRGFAGYVRHQPTNSFAMSSRWEWFDDRDGFTTGTPQRVKETTLTGEWKARKNTLMRLEYRHDWSSRASFLEGSTQRTNHQDTLTVGLITGFNFYVRKR